ncbi:Legume lectin domain - like 2, partial [Theobroma cacao]
MATFSINSYTFSFNLQIFIFLFLAAKPISSFAQQALDNNPSFSPHISLFGDARVEDGGSHVRLTRPHAPSSGLLLLDKPFKFADERNTRFQDQGYFGLFGENRFLGIEFDTKKDDKVGDLNANHVGIDVGSLESVKVSNLSSLNLVLNNGEILKSWVDYDSSSKLLQVRLSKLNDKRPFTPILAYRIDLFEMWGNEDVFVGIISTTNEESSQSSSNVYSWRFRVRDVSSWMHSLPADPRGYVDKDSQEFRAERSKFCALTILAGLIFATGCGALLAFVMLFMWAIMVNRHTVFPVECQAGPDDFRYEKVNVIVEKDDQAVMHCSPVFTGAHSD